MSVPTDAPANEIIPGYRLIEPLGVGGFGKVWKCDAAGSILKAVKIVHGGLQIVFDKRAAQAKLTGGVSPVYAASELFNGVIGLYSDIALRLSFRRCSRGSGCSWVAMPDN